MTLAFDAGATSAGASAVEDSSRTSGSSDSRQNVQFQPARASAATSRAVRWPPKNTRPRAPFAIAWYAMKRSSAFDGNRGTRSGFCFVGIDTAPGDLQRHPDRLRPGGLRIHCVTSRRR